jgi:rod shape-determining protein MreC
MFKETKIKKYSILILLIIICILLFLYWLIISDKRNLTIVEDFVKDSTLMINKTINKPINYIDKKIKEYQNNKKIYQKYNKIKKQYEKTKLLEIKYEESKKELNELKEMLKLNNSLTNYEYLNSSLIIRNIGYFYNEITIDKGEKSGVRKGMAVINNDGLIGTINKTSTLNSTVKLLTTDDTNNKISVKIKISEDEYLYGLLVGYDRNKQNFIIEGIADNKEIPIDSIVTTTGLGSDIPGGIKIGNVKQITKDNFDLSRTLLVKSNVDFDNINYVTILKKEDIK